MPICTVDRKLSGFSDSSSALAARLEVAAICFRRLLREVMTDISDMAKKPFNRTSAKTIRIISDRKSTRLNSSHSQISYAVFCLKKKKNDAASTWPFMRYLVYK